MKEQKTFKKEIRRGRIVRISTKDTVKMKTLESAEKAEETSETEPNVTEVAKGESINYILYHNLLPLSSQIFSWGSSFCRNAKTFLF